MDKLREAARQALEALVVAEGFVDRHSEDWYISGQQDLKQIREAITTMREALEQPCPNGCDTSNDRCVDCPDSVSEQAEQSQLADASLEPVAWLNESEGVDMYAFSWRKKDGFDTPLYAAPVRTKDLTDDEIVKVTGCEKDRPLWLTVSSIARAVIAADREKNRG